MLPSNLPILPSPLKVPPTIGDVPNCSAVSSGHWECDTNVRIKNGAVSVLQPETQWENFTTSVCDKRSNSSRNFFYFVELFAHKQIVSDVSKKEKTRHTILSNPKKFIRLSYLNKLAQFVETKGGQGYNFSMLEIADGEKLEEYLCRFYPTLEESMQQQLDSWKNLSNEEVCSMYAANYGRKDSFTGETEEERRLCYLQGRLVQHMLHTLAKRASTIFQAQCNHLFSAMPAAGRSAFKKTTPLPKKSRAVRPPNQPSSSLDKEVFQEIKSGCDQLEGDSCTSFLRAIGANWSEQKTDYKKSIQEFLLNDKNLEKIFFPLLMCATPPAQLLSFFSAPYHEKAVQRLQEYVESGFKQDYVDYLKRKPSINEIHKVKLSLNTEWHRQFLRGSAIQEKQLEKLTQSLKKIFVNENRSRIFVKLPPIQLNPVVNFLNGTCGCNMSTALNMLSAVDPQVFTIKESEKNGVKALIAHYIGAARQMHCAGFDLVVLTKHMNISSSSNFNFRYDRKGYEKYEDVGEVLRFIFQIFDFEVVPLGRCDSSRGGEIFRTCFRNPNNPETLIISEEKVLDFQLSYRQGRILESILLDNAFITDVCLPYSEQYNQEWFDTHYRGYFLEKWQLFLEEEFFYKKIDSLVQSAQSSVALYKEFTSLFESQIRRRGNADDFNIPTQLAFNSFCKRVRQIGKIDQSHFADLLVDYPWLESFSRMGPDDQESYRIKFSTQLEQIFEYCTAMLHDPSDALQKRMVAVRDLLDAVLCNAFDGYLETMRDESAEKKSVKSHFKQFLNNDNDTFTHQEKRKLLNFFVLEDKLKEIYGCDALASILPEKKYLADDGALLRGYAVEFLGKSLYEKITSGRYPSLAKKLFQNEGIQRYLLFVAAANLAVVLKEIAQSSEYYTALSSCRLADSIAFGLYSPGHYTSLSFKGDKWIFGDMSAYSEMSLEDAAKGKFVGDSLYVIKKP